MKRKAESFLETLSNKNIFKPKVLATVSHNDKWSVGSSIAVSQFLRPLCLHKRIARFKPSLKQAVAFYQPLVIAQNQNWSSWAVTTNSKWELKPACENCARMFGNLNGFIDPNLALGGKDTFLAACAEYFPVNQLLKDEQDPLSLSENERQRINAAVEENRKKCTLYYKNFREIEKKCLDACKAEGESKNVKCAEVYMEINKTVHIFGRKPECNAYFGSVN